MHEHYRLFSNLFPCPLEKTVAVQCVTHRTPAEQLCNKQLKEPQQAGVCIQRQISDRSATCRRYLSCNFSSSGFLSSTEALTTATIFPQKELPPTPFTTCQLLFAWKQAQFRHGKARTEILALNPSRLVMSSQTLQKKTDTPSVLCSTQETPNTLPTKADPKPPSTWTTAPSQQKGMAVQNTFGAAQDHNSTCLLLLRQPGTTVPV